MSNNDDWYLENAPKPSLRLWILSQMTMGAAYAAMVLFGVIAFILILRAVSFLLPEDPFAALELGTRALSALV
ncbi:MAG: RC-LH1 core complex protein PufX [Pseudomonadota bacterium]